MGESIRPNVPGNGSLGLSCQSQSHRRQDQHMQAKPWAPEGVARTKQTSTHTYCDNVPARALFQRGQYIMTTF